MYRVDDLRDQAQGAHCSAVAAGFTALGDDDIGTVFDGELCLAHGRDLLHDEATSFVNTADEVDASVVERERYDGRSTLKRRREGVFVEIRDDVIDCEGKFRQVTKLIELVLELVGWTVPRTETAERLPAPETAAASTGDVKILIPAWMIGTSISNKSHNGERTRPPSRLRRSLPPI